METNTEEATPRPVTTEQASCCLCGRPVDLRKFCAVWKDGRVAHCDPCYDRGWLSSSVADQIVGEIGGEL